MTSPRLTDPPLERNLVSLGTLLGFFLVMMGQYECNRIGCDVLLLQILAVLYDQKFVDPPSKVGYSEGFC